MNMDPDQMAQYWRSLPHQEAAISAAISSLSLSARGNALKALISPLSPDQVDAVVKLWRGQMYSPLMCLVASFEGFSARAYLCPSGVWTIGFGRTTNVQQRDTTSLASEIDWLSHELRSLSRWVSSQYPGIKEEHQIAALVSFVYNVGRSAMTRSTMSRYLLSGDHAAAAREFGRWVYGSVRSLPLPGLVHRREVESALFAFGWTVKKVQDQVEIGRRILSE